MTNISRENYLHRIRPFYEKQLIKVLSGQRRVGKSFLLKQIRDEIKQKHQNANIIYIDKEKHEFDEIVDYKGLHDFVMKKSVSSMNYLFIDEIQEISDFEKALRSLLSEGNFDIYVTGSNSQMLSGELATFLSGRQIEIRVHSLSYLEFLEFHTLQNDKPSLDKYLKFGGLPYLKHLPLEEEIAFDYLKNILATILFRDVVHRYQIRDVPFLDNLVRFLADNTGSLFSATKISDYLKSQKASKTVSVIINYIKYLENAYIISNVKRKDAKGKKIFESGDKFYFEDLGLRNVVYEYKPGDINKIIENAVFNHLRIKNYNVHIGKLENREIDFIAEKNNELIYIQVAYLLSDENTQEREFGNLDLIKDHYPKYVISMDELPVKVSYKGIKHLSLKEFLSEF
ncbi:MAG: ATP-binding protein [Chloroflexia bacterium]|nr:ATP-binding protein [Chloroflexia bacterium]